MVQLRQTCAHTSQIWFLVMCLSPRCRQRTYLHLCCRGGSGLQRCTRTPSAKVQSSASLELLWTYVSARYFVCRARSRHIDQKTCTHFLCTRILRCTCCKLPILLQGCQFSSRRHTCSLSSTTHVAAHTASSNIFAKSCVVQFRILDCDFRNNERLFVTMRT